MSDDQEMRAHYQKNGVKSAKQTRMKDGVSKFSSLTTWGPSRTRKKKRAVGKSGDAK